ncbi:MAG: HEAT repeat domain-containing protein [Planctomycetota bacterium]
MKNSLAYVLIVIQVLTLGTVIGVQIESQRTTQTSVDRLEQIKDSLSGSFQRQSDLVLRLKSTIEDLGRLHDQLRKQGLVQGEAMREPSDDSQIPPTAEAHLRQLLQLFEEMRSAQLNGIEMESMKQRFHAVEDAFVARGPQALVLLPEELRANRSEEVRRYLLGELLNRFAALDVKGCFQAARKVMLDAAASAPLRKLAARQALSFDADAAMIDIRDMLGKAGETNVELRVELLDVLRDHTDPQLEEAICHLAEDRQFGPRIQTAAIRLLAAYKTPGAQAALKRIVDNDSPLAQTEALDAIAKILNKDAIAYLEEVAARDPKSVPDVVRAKAKSLADGLK